MMTILNTVSIRQSNWLALVIAVLLAIPTYQSQADELQRLSAAEIEVLLGGNTAIGEWDGVGYRQYFTKDGTTIYAQTGTRSSRGRWRVNRTKDLYESWWEQSDWTGYPVARDGDTLYWISASLPPQAFEVVSGEQLLAKP